MGSHSTPKFKGWLGLDESAAKGNMKWGEFEPKKWTEDDVDIEISHCGICGTDLHTLRSGWFPTEFRTLPLFSFVSRSLPGLLPLCPPTADAVDTPFPFFFRVLTSSGVQPACVVGHEIVGRAIRVGKNVEHIKVGDAVGVGAQARSCARKDCAECSQGQEQHCKELVNTYGSVYPGDEGKSYGGYADFNRTNGRFVFKLPEGLDPADAAPMLCAGITVFTPLRHNGCGPGKRVGIVGVGGLGHFGVLFARALGADRVVGISRRAEKRHDVLALGADEYIATDADEGWASRHAKSLDLIVSTVSSENMPFDGYLSLLATGGTLIQVGAPDGGKLPPISVFTLVQKNIKIGGSLIGAPWEIEEMLRLAVEKKVKPWVQKRPLKDANQAILDMDAGKARYRYVLVNENFGKHGV